VWLKLSVYGEDEVASLDSKTHRANGAVIVQGLLLVHSTFIKRRRKANGQLLSRTHAPHQPCASGQRFFASVQKPPRALASKFTETHQHIEVRHLTAGEKCAGHGLKNTQPDAQSLAAVSNRSGIALLVKQDPKPLRESLI
jgi:hypothetical protein